MTAPPQEPKQEDEKTPTRFDVKTDYDVADVIASVVTGTWWLVRRKTLKAGIIPIITGLLGSGSVVTSIQHFFESHTEIVAAKADSTQRGSFAAEVRLAGVLYGYDDPKINTWHLVGTNKILVNDTDPPGRTYWVVDDRLNNQGIAQMARDIKQQ